MRSDEAHAFLRSRRSIRRFKDEPVPDEVLGRVLETAAFAPSAHNRQPWRAAIVSSAEARLEMAKAMGEPFRRDLLAEGIPQQEADLQVQRSRQRILEAPVVLVLCCDRLELELHTEPDRARGEEEMALQSTALFGGTLLLAAHAEGLGAVWVCAPLFAQEEVRRSLDLPESWQPQGMILLGYPLQIPQARPRRSVSEFTKTI